MSTPRIDFIELPASDIADSRRFYQSVFGWGFSMFGPDYACTTSGDVDLGLQADRSEAPASALPVVQVSDLDAALNSVRAAGGSISKAIFSFPGGRRFHFRDPAGNELAVWQKE